MNLREQIETGVKGARSLWTQALDVDRLEIALVLTVGLLLVHGGTSWIFTVPMTMLCLAGFVLRPLLLNSSYWLILSAVVGFANFRNWHSVDDQKFLATYWCIAVYCSLLTPDPRGAASGQARWLVGLCMVFSVAWKVISPDYLSGQFLKYELLTDGRFGWIARAFAGVPASSLHSNALRLAEMRAFDSAAVAAPLLAGPRLGMVAQVMTWWTIGIEALTALAFLAPARVFLSRWRHSLLAILVLTTCAAASVPGFGWLLLVMGIAIAPQEDRRTRGIYFACFIFLHVFLLPLRNL
ncbi:MAG: hypothetical protein K8T20_13455 [Planctomycetes bacterium]|nr:hypothetical protein [Planctomycetota bacterium]